MKKVFIFVALSLVGIQANAQQSDPSPTPTSVSLSQFAGTYSGKTLLVEDCTIELTASSIVFRKGGLSPDVDSGGQPGETPVTGTETTDGQNTLAHFNIPGEEQVTFDLILSADKQSITSVDFHSEYWDVPIPVIHTGLLWNCSSLKKVTATPSSVELGTAGAI